MCVCQRCLSLRVAEVWSLSYDMLTVTMSFKSDILVADDVTLTTFYYISQYI